MSDNGGENFPGIKTNLPMYEGGTRVLGFIRGDGVTAGRKYSGLMRWALLMESVDVIYPSGPSGGSRLVVDVMTYRERRGSSPILG